MKVVMQMDHLSKLHADSDSTIALIEEALRRDFEVYFYIVEDIVWRNGSISVNAYRVSGGVKIGDQCELDLNSADVVWVRQDPPFDMRYMTSTYALDSLDPEVLVLNNPTSIRDMPEKLFALNKFHQFMPATMVTESLEAAEEFLVEKGNAIMKPLYGCGGQDIAKFSKNKIKEFCEEFKRLKEKYSTPLMIQEFLPSISSGDKRIILVNGEYAGAVNRTPKKGDVRANMVAGGIASKTEISDKEREICEVIGKELKTKNIMLAGVDMIGGYLTEINITSPTGIKIINKLDALEGKDSIEARVWSAVEKKLQNK